jgi:hypothetical protein
MARTQKNKVRRGRGLHGGALQCVAAHGQAACPHGAARRAAAWAAPRMAWRAGAAGWWGSLLCRASATLAAGAAAGRARDPSLPSPKPATPSGH